MQKKNLVTILVIIIAIALIMLVIVITDERIKKIDKGTEVRVKSINNH